MSLIEHHQYSQEEYITFFIFYCNPIEYSTEPYDPPQIFTRPSTLVLHALTSPGEKMSQFGRNEGHAFTLNTPLTQAARVLALVQQG